MTITELADGDGDDVDGVDCLGKVPTGVLAQPDSASATMMAEAMRTSRGDIIMVGAP